MIHTLMLVLGITAMSAGPVPLDRLLVRTELGTFSVKEPPGWQADTDSLAESYQVNVVFIKTSESPEAHRVSIRVRLNCGQPKDIAADMEADMAGYRRQHPGITFPQLSIKHGTYSTVARIFRLPSRFSEYVAYVDPGPTYPYVFSVAFSTPDSAATPQELSALETVLKSLSAIRSK